MLWFLVILAAVAFIIIGMYNSLVRLRVRVNGAWADIDVQLRRRWDLIPNLMETVEASAGHERETLEAVVEARHRAMGARGPTEAGAAEG
ncbi:MAG: LemA family protein, partial [Gemmatimonadales bacterium]|nr:LemA family protein [Candidatus Palauibacter denitrificans]